jgi:cellulose synthase/poly-beta-1,6-N-acetylglucosamine synthase-like glycosyltransferase
MSLPIYYYVLGTPLGMLGLIRWGCWLVRRIPAALYRPITGSYRLPMTIVVPVYQEDPEVFAAAIESWLANGVDEVILVIDVSDDVCREVAGRYPVRVLITDVPGKRDALRRGWNAARTELVALVDSDTVWAPDVAVEVCKPFADPRIGGVGTRQNVYGSKGFLARITDMFLDHRYFDENASQSLLGQAVSCLSGRTAIYRRALLLDIEHEFMNETFWGVPCLSGDDKRLTTLILERGYKTYMQRTAEVWSTFPSKWKIFFRQRLRWARNTWRSDLRALSRRWVWRHPFLAYTMVDKGISSFTLLFGPTFMIYSLIVQNWVFAGVLALWWQISRSAKLLPHLRRRPSSFFLVPGYLVVSWLMALIKLQALFTIRKQRWLTRQVAVQNGAVVRTEQPADSSPPPHAGHTPSAPQPTSASQSWPPAPSQSWPPTPSQSWPPAPSQPWPPSADQSWPSLPSQPRPEQVQPAWPRSGHLVPPAPGHAPPMPARAHPDEREVGWPAQGTPTWRRHAAPPRQRSGPAGPPPGDLPPPPNPAAAPPAGSRPSAGEPASVPPPRAAHRREVTR